MVDVLNGCKPGKSGKAARIGVWLKPGMERVAFADSFHL